MRLQPLGWRADYVIFGVYAPFVGPDLKRTRPLPDAPSTIARKTLTVCWIYPLSEIAMIARIWRGITLVERADDYLAYLHETGLKDYAKTPGNRGVSVLRRNQGEHCEIVLISLWDSMDAVRAFAGENPDKSVYYPEDDQYLLQMEPLVRHYDVAEQIASEAAPAADIKSAAKKRK